MEENKSEYQKSIDYLFSQLPMFSRTGAPAYKPGLDTSLNLSKYFDDPHKKFKSIHIGGTNGKGSTSHLIASVLQSQGYKVGLYTSPHLIDFRERMKINGQMIPEEKVIDFVKKWQDSDFDGHPSFFELTMIMAFNWFADEKVDYAVIEVGMGGRLDSTNIITPLLSVITNISHDHNQFLGETLPQIAAEKAGIIKPKVPVVIGETQSETQQVFQEKAKDQGTEIIFADQVLEPLKQRIKELIEKGELEFPLKGDYQKKNIDTAITAICKLQSQGVEISEEAIISGIQGVCTKTGLKGRWMILDQSPLTIADTGHNIAGITYNVNQLEYLIKDRPQGKLRIIIGFVADKAIDKIMDILPKNALYYVTNAQIPRALQADILCEKFIKSGFEARMFSTPWEAYIEAKKEASAKDIIFIGGSTFVVADFLSCLSNLESC